MTSSPNQFDDLERRLKAGWQWSDTAPPVSAEDLAAWVDQPVEHEAIEAALAHDANLRAAVVELRRGAHQASESPSPALLRRVQALVPDRPAIAGRIGLWAAAAAAAVLLAFGGWQLGSASGTDRSLDTDTLAFATFGLSTAGVDENGSFLVVSEFTAEPK